MPALWCLPAALLASACTDPTVVVQPVGIRNVDARLMVSPKMPSCEVDQAASGLYAYEELDASRRCWRQGVVNAHARLRGLQKAVRVREAALAKAKAAAQ